MNKLLKDLYDCFYTPPELAAPASETMGSTSPYLDCTRSSTSMAWLYVQKEPQKANPIFLCSMFTLLIR